MPTPAPTPALSASHWLTHADFEDTSQRLAHTATGPVDDEIMWAYRHCREKFAAALPTWIAGIQNSRGDIYRMVILEGLAQADKFSAMLLHLGYARADHALSRATASLDAVFAWNSPR